ncbi:MAG: oligosaccharide flippase family protein [Solirubrobacterales bacterium]|nr:oligosaccharide flippase family protein [Solirubrobacterales bacterium]
MTERRLRHDAASAFGWIAAAKMFERVLGIVRIVVLARVLAPEDFGAFAVALLALATLERLSRSGLAIAIVQRKGDVSPYLSAVWSVFVVRGLILAALLFLSRHLVADFFNAPDAGRLIGWVALAVAIAGFASLSIHLLQRELRLKARFRVFAVSGLLDTLVAIPLAIALHDPIALVYGMLARNAALTLGSFVIHPHRPRFTLNWRPLLDLREFAVQGGLQSWLFLVVEYGDDAYVGKALGDVALGVYSVVYRVANILTQEFARVMSEVTLPVFSRVQDDRERLVRGIRESTGGTAAIVLPGTLFLVMVADPFVSVVLGDRWLSGVHAFQILLAFGLLRALSQVMESGLVARGEIAFVTRVLVIQLVTAAALVLTLGEAHGLAGVATGIAASQLISLTLSSRRLSHGLAVSWTSLFAASRGPLVAAAAAGIAAGGVIVAVSSTGSDLLTLFLGGTVFTGIYVPMALPSIRRDLPMITAVILDRLPVPAFLRHVRKAPERHQDGRPPDSD